MRKRTRIAIVVAALLVSVVGPTAITAGNRQDAEASAPDWRAAYRALDNIIPRTGWTRTGRSVALTPQRRWQLANVACTVNEVHDNVYEYEDEVDYLLSELGWFNPYRFQSPTLELSRRIYQFKDDSGPMYDYGSQVFCDYAKDIVEQYAATR
jgi:hypothetical protein